MTTTAVIAMRVELMKLAALPRQFLYGLGAIAGGLGLNHLANNSFESSLKSSRRSREDRALVDKVLKSTEYPVSYNTKSLNAILLDATPEELKEYEKEFKLKDKLIPGKHNILLDKRQTTPAILAHEIGHGDFHKGSVGRVLQQNGGEITTLGNLAGFGLGLAAGSKNGSPSTALSAASVALPILAAFVADVPELAASYKAVQSLKGHGATDEQLQRAKSQLIRAYATYASRLPISAVPGLVGQGIGQHAKLASLNKAALLERLVRLGATDIPKTPRLLMKQRSPQDLATLQHGVDKWWHGKVTSPLMGVAERGLTKLPQGKLQNVARRGAQLVAEDPVGSLLANAVPVPGAHPAYIAGKKGLERLIDRAAPLASTPPTVA